MGNEITPVKILELAKNGWDAIIELYKHSDKDTKKQILKILGGLVGFGTLLKYLREL